MSDLLRAATENSFEPYFTACRSILGPENFFESSQDRHRYSKDCGLVSRSPRAILIPNSVEQLQTLVREANSHKIPIHAVSRGKNWGYGSAAAHSDNAVIIDLQRLNKIHHVDSELAYAIIEPGVTQQQLYSYLEEHAPGLCMDVTGSSPESSLIGNLVERGYGQTPYGDRFLHSAGMEVMLCDGSIVKLGFGHYENSKSHHLYKWGLGPYLDGLFTQSNFGIVVRTGLWLMPKPKEIGLLTFAVDKNSDLLSVLAVMRKLKLEGLLPATVHISNDIRLASCFTQFPIEQEDPAKPLPETAVASLRKRFGFGRWNCFTSLRGSRRQIRTALHEISCSLRPFVRPTFVSKRSVFWSRKLGILYSFTQRRNAEKTEMLFNLVSGRPTEGPTLGAFWRHPEKPITMPLDPAADGCGLVWLAPIIPTSESEISNFLESTEGVLLRFGFEMNVTLTMLSERALCATIAITFDKSNATERAGECYETLLTIYIKSGWIPYRHGINVESVRERLFSDSDPYWQLCRKLKQAIDPNAIFSPGKYGL